MSAAFDRQSGRVVYVDSGGDTWTFDVCTNTWKQETTRGEGPSNSADLFYDPRSDRTYALDEGGLPAIRYYDVETSTWSTVGRPGRSWAGADQFVMDPVDGVIYGYHPGAELWAYDIASNAWTKVEQGELRPPTDWWGAMTTFDPSAGRIVLYGERSHDPAIEPPTEPPDSDQTAETWTFDLGTNTWTRVATETPLLAFGWFMRGTEMTYDEASRSTVLVASGGMAVFYAAANHWRVPQPRTGQDMIRLGHGLVDDVVNGRVLVFGGDVPDPQSDSQWQPGTDVWAYDVDTNKWTELVPQQPS